MSKSYALQAPGGRLHILTIKYIFFIHGPYVHRTFFVKLFVFFRVQNIDPKCTQLIKFPSAEPMSEKAAGTTTGSSEKQTRQRHQEARRLQGTGARLALKGKEQPPPLRHQHQWEQQQEQKQQQQTQCQLQRNQL
jgi:hypothetical protein